MIKHSLSLLEVLQKMKPYDVPKVVDHLNDESIDSICECVYNIIHTNLNLPARKRAQLKKHIKSNCSIPRLKKICNKGTPLCKRRKALQQEGKGLPFLLAAAIPFLTSLFAVK